MGAKKTGNNADEEAAGMDDPLIQEDVNEEEEAASVKTGLQDQKAEDEICSNNNDTHGDRNDRVGVEMFVVVNENDHDEGEQVDGEEGSLPKAVQENEETDVN